MNYVPSQAEDCWLPTPFASFPFTSPPVRRRVPPDSVSTLQQKIAEQRSILLGCGLSLQVINCDQWRTIFENIYTLCFT